MIELVVHSFSVGDVEDPDIYAAGPIWEWQNTEQGKWIMDHAVEPPSWHRSIDNLSYSYKFNIRAKLEDHDSLYYKLKWGDNQK